MLTERIVARELKLHQFYYPWSQGDYRVLVKFPITQKHRRTGFKNVWIQYYPIKLQILLLRDLSNALRTDRAIIFVNLATFKRIKAVMKECSRLKDRTNI